jgi:hypothetical protein
VSEPGVILAAKPGDVTPGSMILRLYQPSNSPQSLTVTLGGGRQPARVVAVTALEDPIPEAEAPRIALAGNQFTMEATAALNTVQIEYGALCE